MFVCVCVCVNAAVRVFIGVACGRERLRAPNFFSPARLIRLRRCLYAARYKYVRATQSTLAAYDLFDVAL